MKLHKEHTNGAGEGLTPCKVSYDPTTAKEMLLMASSLEEQQFWVARLLKKIQKGGYKAAGQVSLLFDIYFVLLLYPLSMFCGVFLIVMCQFSG